MPSDDARTAQLLAPLRAEWRRVRKLAAAHQGRWEKAQAQLDHQIQRLAADLETQPDEASARIDDLERRLAEADERLAEAQQRAADGGQNGGPPADDNLQRQYELALDDLRELKAKNADLQQQVARLRAANTTNIIAGQSAGGVLDWEAEKARILAVLEADADQTDRRRSERLKIEDVVRATDQVIAAKDQQLEALKKQLADTSPAGARPATAAEMAQAAILDQDEVVRQERDRLQALQQEWSEKLRQAEIEISLQRAALARERAELEARRRPGGSPPQASSSTTSTPPAKPARGRWLTHLGLAGAEPTDEQTARP